MKERMILYTFFIIIALGSYIPEPTRIDPAFSQLVYRFENLYKTDLKHWFIQIEFADLERPIVGQCEKMTSVVLNFSTKRKIKIDKRTWDKLGIFEQESLIMHELLHCIADLEHDNFILEDGCPRSIMYYDYIPYTCLIEYRQKYLNEVIEAGRKRNGENPRK